MSDAKVTPELIRAALTTVKYPGFSRDIVSFGLVKNIEVSAEGAVRIELRIESKNEDVPRFVYQSVMTEVKEMPGVKSIDVDIEYHNPDVEKKAAMQDDPAKWKTPLPGVKHIIGISSGKFIPAAQRTVSSVQNHRRSHVPASLLAVRPRTST